MAGHQVFRNGLNVSSPTSSQEVHPASPAHTHVSSSTTAGSPAQAAADPFLDATQKLVAKTIRAKRALDIQEDAVLKEGNAISSEQAELDRAQEALDVRKRTHERNDEQVKRARKEYEDDKSAVDRKLTYPDYDDDE